MIVFSRDLARKFRTVAKKCLTRRRRSPPPPVVCRSQGGNLTMTAQLDEVGLSLTVPEPVNRDETLIVPMTVFEAVEGVGDEAVELDVTAGTSGMARWSHRGVPKSLPFEALKPDRTHESYPRPEKWASVPKHFLAALHECGRTAAREASRFALNKVQVRGKKGQVIGTDGKTALITDGFSFPFSEDLLVPAIPVFGCRDWGEPADVRLGRTEKALAVRVGSWVVWLLIDATSRFPDVAGVMPRSMNPSVVGIDEKDARDLLDRFADLPSAEDDNGAITLDLDGTAMIRAKGVSDIVAVRLSRSPVAGPPVRTVLDRAMLQRALTLGCFTARVAGPGKPVMFEGAGRTFLVAALDPSVVVPPTPDAHVFRTDPIVTDPKSTTSLRRSPMKPNELNGHAGNGRSELPSSVDAPDPLVEAEALRVVLADATVRAGRLVAALKHSRKQKKALESVFSSLQQLNLGGNGPGG